MKKIIILSMLLILTLSGCKGTVKNIERQNDTSKINSSEVLDDEIIYEEGVWPDKNWSDIEFPFEEDCVPDKETAINITQILIEKFQQQNSFINYVPESVFYDTEDKIWIITFAEDFDYPRACVCFAIRKDNAEVVKIWLGE